jgi:hypothetical protein
MTEIRNELIVLMHIHIFTLLKAISFLKVFFRRVLFDRYQQQEEGSRAECFFL